MNPPVTSLDPQLRPCHKVQAVARASSLHNRAVMPRLLPAGLIFVAVGCATMPVSPPARDGIHTVSRGRRLHYFKDGVELRQDGLVCGEWIRREMVAVPTAASEMDACYRRMASGLGLVTFGLTLSVGAGLAEGGGRASDHPVAVSLAVIGVGGVIGGLLLASSALDHFNHGIELYNHAVTLKVGLGGIGLSW